MKITDKEMRLFRKTLNEALDGATQVLKKRFLRVSIQYKGRANLVTEADFESQKKILSIFKRHVPLHDYQAEENGIREAGSPFQWVVDPLDGTTNYAHGFPVSCVSIALLFHGKPLLAGIADPFRNERFIAEKGRGAFLNGKRIYVSRVKSLSESLLITGFPYDRHKRSHFYVDLFRRFLLASHDVRRLGSAALDLAWIACGRADGFWEFHLKPWDVSAGLLLVEEAGGRVTDFQGRIWKNTNSFGPETLATNGLIHREMTAFLKSRKGEGIRLRAGR